MPEQFVRNLVDQSLNSEISRHPYYKARVNVYHSYIDTFFVVSLYRSDIYLYTCFRLEIENLDVVSIYDNYIEQQTEEEECSECPDPDAQILLTCPTTEFPTGPKCLKEVKTITEIAGLKTVYLEGKEEALDVIKSYLSCPKLIMWARIGHGNKNGFILGKGNFNTSEVNSLKGDKLKEIRLHANSCSCHQGSFEQAILNAGAYFFCGGDIPLATRSSEKVTLNFLKKIIMGKKEVEQSLTAAMDEEKFKGFGISGTDEKPWFWWPADFPQYINFFFPDKNARIERYSYCTVKWSDNIRGPVTIELLRSGSYAEILAQSTESDGIFQWAVNETEAGPDYKIRIVSIDSSNLFQESESFSIIKEFIISDFPYIQSFDQMGTDSTNELSENWKQLYNDDFDWIVTSGPTHSTQYLSTGVRSDRTGKGKFAYIEASNQNHPNRKADMITPAFNLTNLDKPELSFWAHMKSDSNTMGNIYIDIYVDGLWNNDVIHLQKDHGESWFEVKQDLSNYQGNMVKFRFRAVTGTSWCSDMCIDDFMIADSASIFRYRKNYSSLNFTLNYFGSKIMYKIPGIQNKSTHVNLSLYNFMGQLVKILVNSELETGYYSIDLNTDRSLASGIYLCRLESLNFSKTINIMVDK
jgi:hypothetical protein